MATQVSVLGTIRGAVRRALGIGVESNVALGDGLELLVQQTMPPMADLARLAQGWHILSAATAALTALPTTPAGHSLRNGEAAGGKSYIIDSFGTVEIVIDATQGNSLALFAMMNKGTTAALTDASLARGSMNGRTYGGLVQTQAGATVVDEVWTPIGAASPAGATAYAGQVWRVTERECKGEWFVPPGGQFNIACAKLAATASQIRYFIRWHEVQLALA